MDKEVLKKNREYPFLSFARGSRSYYVLGVVILIILVFGIFDPGTGFGKREVLGSYSNYNIVSEQQGKTVFEVYLQHKKDTKVRYPIPREAIKNIIWIVNQSYDVQSYHEIEEEGIISGLVITVRD